MCDKNTQGTINHLEANSFASIEGSLYNTVCHFLHWKGTIEGTLLCFLAHWATIEGHLLCFICHRGIQNGALAGFLSNRKAPGCGGVQPDTQHKSKRP